MENVYEMPSSACSYGIFATDAIDATAPRVSLPCSGFAPGANGSPFFLPQGVLPVFFPYTTLDVIVSTDSVGTDLRYVFWRRSLFMNFRTMSTAILSTRSSLLPNAGYSPSMMKSTAMPRSSRTGFTRACLIAERESATTESPAMPHAMVRYTTRSWSAISNLS